MILHVLASLSDANSCNTPPFVEMYLRLLNRIWVKSCFECGGKEEEDYSWPIPSTSHISLREKNSTVVSTNPFYYKKHFLTTFHVRKIIEIEIV